MILLKTGFSIICVTSLKILSDKSSIVKLDGKLGADKFMDKILSISIPSLVFKLVEATPSLSA